MLAKSRIASLAVCFVFSFSVKATLIDVFQGGLGSSSYKGTIEAYSGADPAKANYDYFSHSGHPAEGPNTRFNRGEVFFYDGPEGTTFNVIFNKDRVSSSDPVTVGKVSWNIAAGSVIGDPSVLLSDDKKELKEEDFDTFKGRWEWRNNSDGGIIDGLGLPFWIVAVDPKEYEGLDALKVFGAEGERIDLNLRTGDRGTMFFMLHVPEGGSTVGLLSMGMVGIGLVSRRNKAWAK
jgi:hypothetical protein